MCCAQLPSDGDGGHMADRPRGLVHSVAVPTWSEGITKRVEQLLIHGTQRVDPEGWQR
jgi:hypothetical protein